LSAYKIQLHGTEWIVSLSADWDQSPTKKKKKKIFRALFKKYVKINATFFIAKSSKFQSQKLNSNAESVFT
jgi:hypothetical protein